MKYILSMLFICMTLSIMAQDSPASLYNQGLEKAKAKEYAEAVELMGQAIEAADPENETDAKVIKLAKANGSRAAYALGTQQRKDGELDAALMTFEKGTEFSPDYYSNFVGVAQVYEDQDKPAEAAKAYVLAGKVAEAGDKADKAVDLYGKAENIVAVAWSTKDWPKAIGVAEGFLSTERSSADVSYYLAFAQHESGNTEAALENVKKAIDMGDDTGKYYMLLGEVNAKLGKKADAIAAYQKVTDSKYSDRAKYEITELEGEN